MTDQQSLSPLKQAYIALEKMQARLEAAERDKNNLREPIAVIGIGCRFPGGVDSPESFWNLLRDGVDAISDLPADRWNIDEWYDADPDAPGKMSTRSGGFLQNVDLFDPQFFGIAPREAASMDPQQRLLLEVAWEALERAGTSPDKLFGSKTGVYVGLTGNDYVQVHLDSGGVNSFDQYYSSGIAHSIASGRLSYILGLNGPSISLDTACSSSLVAVHLAVQGLRNRDTNMALAGGVNLILSPEISVALSKYHMMSPAERCKFGDASADGFVRGEGAGVVVLKRLSDALADGDPIVAVIRGTAVNQDGASSGLTAPNGPSQEAVIRDALANAGLQPSDVGYIEAHGTGTELGDPIEVQALGATLSAGRDANQPLLVGSVKTNIGHIEAASGVAGLIKAILTVQHGEIPASLHFNEPSPHIPWGKFPLRVVTEHMVWESDKPRVAGVSSFGFSGTNAHILVEQPPASIGAQHVAPLPERPLHVLALSAQNERALKQLAGRISAYLADEAGQTDAHASRRVPTIENTSYTLNSGRGHFAYRLALAADDAEQARGLLAEYADGGQPAGLISGRVPSVDAPRVVFLFTGQGAQYAHMGRELYDTQPTFRAVLDECDTILREYLNGVSILDIMFSDDGRVNETQYTQPALFAIEYALAKLWESWGVRPNAVMGHSVGEYVAACVAGLFSLEDGLKLIAARGQLMGGLPAGGTMVAVFADEVTVAEAIKPYAKDVSIAAVNGFEQIVISGVKTTIETIRAALKEQGIGSRPLTVSHAFHSPLMNPILDEFEKVAASMAFTAPRVKIISNVTGQQANADIMKPAYWRRHIREAVQFAGSMQTLHEQGYSVFVEIGPAPTLIGMGKRTLAEDEGVWLPSLTKAGQDWSTILSSLQALYLQGASIDWAGFDKDYSRRKLVLPTYPFQRARYWVKQSGRKQSADAVHPLLGRRVRSPQTARQYEAVFSTGQWGFLDDHRVQGRTILPAAGFIEMALAAGDGRALSDVVINESLVINGDDAPVVTTLVTKDGAFEIYSQAHENADWVLHVSGQYGDPDARSQHAAPLQEMQGRIAEGVGREAHYGLMRARGLDFGAALLGVEDIWRGENEALGLIQLPATRELNQYLLHPALLDACLQVFSAAFEGGDAFLPFSIDGVRLYQRPTARVWSHGALRESNDPNAKRGDLTIFDENGELIAEVEGIYFRRAAAPVHKQLFEDWLYKIEWEAKPLPSQIPAWLDHQILDLMDQYGMDAEAFAQVEDLGAAYVIRAFQQLGFAFTQGARTTTDEIQRKLKIPAKYTRLLKRLLNILAEIDILSEENGAWVVEQTPQVTDLDAFADDLLARYPLYEPYITVAHKCGRELADTLTGKADIIQLLFPGGSAEQSNRLYRDSPQAKVFNTLVAEAVKAALPEKRPAKILEIGAGTGGTTATILPMLNTEVAEYAFTDISPLFLARAEEQFGAYPFMRYQLLNIENEPTAQGFEAGVYDVILAVNVLHATADLRVTLEHARKLLAPGGTMIIREMTTPERWCDVSYGLTDGWWRYTDTNVRADYPLIDRAAWVNLLTELGFEAAGAAPHEFEGETVITASVPHTDEQTGSWLIFSDAGGYGYNLSELLTEQGYQTHSVNLGTEYAYRDGNFILDPTKPEHFTRLLNEVGTLAGIVHLWTPYEQQVQSGHAYVYRGGAVSLLYLTQALASSGSTARLYVLTIDAFEDAYQEAIVWGMVKSIALEHPELRPTAIDLNSAYSEHILAEILSDSGETQIRYIDGARHVARLAHHNVGTRYSAADNPQPFKLVKDDSGVLDNLKLVPTERRAPGRGEVEIQVFAAALNFRDVMNALAMRDDPEPLGGECSGRIVAVGEGVTEFEVGDEVIALTPNGSFATYATERVEYVLHKPQNMTFEHAAAFPIAYLTAHYALNHIAQIKAGDKVLIHAAAGGVGMAAVKLAQQAGAEIFATAGSDEKRALLRSMGVQHVFNSRVLDFSDEILALTNGVGVDVILNSLSGDFIPASVNVLAANGRFLEIGKRDIWTDEQFAQVKPNAAYHIVDFLPYILNEPLFVRGLLEELLNKAQHVAPLQITTFPMEQGSEAFRYMAQARHAGKIVLTNPHPGVTIREKATYLITGGLTGIGLLTARWLVDKGARHLVLMGRREPNAEAQAAIADMEASGAQVIVGQGDVSVIEDVRTVFQMIDDDTAPLRGIIHAAGTLADGAILRQDWERFQKPLQAKVEGTWNLYDLTWEMGLDFFVMYSSTASLFGSAGQANHAAANAYMDGLAVNMEAPYFSINWGAWAETGAAVDYNVEERIAAKGVGMIPPEQGLLALEALLSDGSAANVAVTPIDWPTFMQQYDGDVPLWLSRMAQTAKIEKTERAQIQTATSAAPNLLEQLNQADPLRQRDLLLNFIGEQVARVLGLANAQSVDERTPLNEMGLDSLMAVELRNRLSSGLGLAKSLPATLVFDYPTVDALIDYVRATVLKVEESAPKAEAKPTSVEDMSDEEVEALFAKKMQGLK